MKRYRKIGMLLTGSPADPTALAYAARIVELAGSEEVVAVCEQRMQGQPTEIDPGALEQQFRHAVGDHPVNIEFRSSNGNGLTDFLRIARDRALDLVIKGRRLPSNDLSNATAARLARKAPCTTLVVPTQRHVHVTRILVPVDFSEHSRMALDTALDIARATGKDGRHSQVLAMTTYAVTYGYAKTGMKFSEAASKAATATREHFDRFLQGADLSNVDFDTFIMCTENTARGIHDVATSRKLDMIVLGSRGLTATAAAVIGSTTEGIVQRAALPVLVIKKKGETVGLLNALLDQVSS